jgi:hypothetical protein
MRSTSRLEKEIKIEATRGLITNRNQMYGDRAGNSQW